MKISAVCPVQGRPVDAPQDENGKNNTGLTIIDFFKISLHKNLKIYRKTPPLHAITNQIRNWRQFVLYLMRHECRQLVLHRPPSGGAKAPPVEVGGAQPISVEGAKPTGRGNLASTYSGWERANRPYISPCELSQLILSPFREPSRNHMLGFM